MKRQIGNAPQQLSEQTEALLRTEIETLKGMADTLHSCIGTLRSAMHILTHENKTLIGNVQELESRIKMQSQIVGNLEGKLISLTHEKEVLIKENEGLLIDIKEKPQKFSATTYDDLLDDISCQEELFGAMVTEVILTGDIT